MFTILKTKNFDKQLDKLKDRHARLRILDGIRRMELGLFGDVKPIGEGVSEARIHYGAGYRLYFCQRGHVMIVLLCGGDKSTQSKDIQKAKELKKCLK